MKIDLRPIKHEIGAVIPFSFNISIAEREPLIPGPVEVSGEVRNRAGYLILSVDMTGVIETQCDRCLEPISREFTTSFEAVLADSVEDDADEEIIVYENDEFSPDEIAASVYILELPSKNLCRDDCKGLCMTCGANLNESACSCKAEEVDPRLSKLKLLLDE